MHMYPINVHIGELDDTQQMGDLVDTDPELGIYMSDRNIGVPPGHHVRIYAYTYWDVRMLAAKLFQDGQIVYIDANAQFSGFLYLFQGYPIWGVDDGVRFESGV